MYLARIFQEWLDGNKISQKVACLSDENVFRLQRVHSFFKFLFFNFKYPENALVWSIFFFFACQRKKSQFPNKARAINKNFGNTKTGLLAEEIVRRRGFYPMRETWIENLNIGKSFSHFFGRLLCFFDDVLTEAFQDWRKRSDSILLCSLHSSTSATFRTILHNVFSALFFLFALFPLYKSYTKMNRERNLFWEQDSMFLHRMPNGTIHLANAKFPINVLRFASRMPDDGSVS